MKQAYIVAGFRTAVGKAKRGGFRFTSPVDLAADVINGLLDKLPQLNPDRIDDILVGNAVPEAEQGLQMGRWISVKSNFNFIKTVLAIKAMKSEYNYLQNYKKGERKWHSK